MTHTYALLELSPPTYGEIADKLRAAGYEHAFGERGEIDMHGIGIATDEGARILKIFGIEYDLELFRTLGLGAIGGVFRIVGRTDGVVTLQSLEDIETGWVIENGHFGADRRFRMFDEIGMLEWTADIDLALRFARRTDAERFCASDEDAWLITERVWRRVNGISIAINEEGALMYLTISKSGLKADIVEQVRGESNSSPPVAVEKEIRGAIADHLQKFAQDGVPVSVSCSVSLSYAAATDTEGKELSAETGAIAADASKT